MVETDLVISSKFKQLLPALSNEEAAQLEENIVKDGRVRDAILYWHHGGKNLVVDGLHRCGSAKRTGLPFRTEPMEFQSYEDAELWILNNALGRRNLMKPHEVRTVRGNYYNKLKRKDGGHGDQKSEGQNVPPAAKVVAEKAGVDEKTVKRDGKRVELINTLPEPIQKAIHTDRLPVSDDQLKALAKLDADKQIAVAREVRTAAKPTAKVIDAALEKNGATVKPKRTPKCEHSWVNDGNGERYCEHCKEDHPENSKEEDSKDQIPTQRQKTVKTVEALMRAFDDLNDLLPKSEHKNAIRACKELLETAKAWK